MATKSYVDVTDSNFDVQVLQSDVPVLVDFGAAWCGPCRALEPVIEALGNEYEGKARIAKMDVDSNPTVSIKYGIRNLPTLLIFKGGQVVDKVVGAVPKKVLADRLDKQI